MSSTSSARSFTISNTDAGGYSPIGASAGNFGKNKRSKATLAGHEIIISPSVTRIAVELTLPDNHLSGVTVESLLQSIQHLFLLDCVFVTLFDKERKNIEWVNSSSVGYEHCNPYELLNAKQPCNSGILERLANYRLLEINDCVKRNGEYAEFKAGMVHLNLGSMLVGGITNHGQVIGLMVFGSLRSRQSWSAELYLAMKLMCASYAAGLERYKLNLCAG